METTPRTTPPNVPAHLLGGRPGDLDHWPDVVEAIEFLPIAGHSLTKMPTDDEIRALYSRGVGLIQDAARRLEADPAAEVPTKIPGLADALRRLSAVQEALWDLDGTLAPVVAFRERQDAPPAPPQPAAAAPPVPARTEANAPYIRSVAAVIATLAALPPERMITLAADLEAGRPIVFTAEEVKAAGMVRATDRAAAVEEIEATARAREAETLAELADAAEGWIGSGAVPRG